MYQQTARMIQVQIKDIMSKYIYEKNTAEIRTHIKYSIESALHIYQDQGLIIGELPLVDVNHDLEINHVEKEIQKLVFELDRNYTENEIQNPNQNIEISNKIAMLNWRLNALKDQIGYDPSRIGVYFKHQQTFEPYSFR